MVRPSIARVAMEGPLPEGVAQNRHCRAIGNVLLATEFPADSRRNAQHAEVAGRDPLLLDILGPVAGGKVDTAGAAIRRHVQSRNVVANRFEQGAGLRSVDIFGTATVRGGGHQGKTIGLRIWGGTQQNGVQDAEYGGVYPDAEGQRADHDERECRAFAKLP